MMCGSEGFDVAIKDGDDGGHIAWILVYPKRKIVLEGVKDSTVPGSIGSLEEYSY